MTDNDIIMAVIFTTLVLLLLVAGIAITFFVTIRQRLEQKMKMKQVALEYEQELRAAEAEVSESVRAHLSREIHDNIGHMLTYLRLQMENKMLDDEAIAHQLEPMLKTTAEISQQLRLFSRALNPEFIKDHSLLFMLKQEAERISHLNKMQVHWTDDGEIYTALTKNQQLFIFRIYQEILHNALKHSQATNLYIEVSDQAGLTLSVTDDGKGFDIAAKTQTSNGLKNILKRAELSSMECSITTAPGKGCKITITPKGQPVETKERTNEYSTK